MRIFQDIAWGVGLIVIGAVIARIGFRLARNSDGVADDYYWSMIATRRGRRLVDAEPRTVRWTLGPAIVMFGALFVAVGVYGLVRGLILI